jgi:hypothetical protein
MKEQRLFEETAPARGRTTRRIFVPAVLPCAFRRSAMAGLVAIVWVADSLDISPETSITAQPLEIEIDLCAIKLQTFLLS